MEKIKIGITAGDMNGISLEVILKALHQDYIFQHVIPIIYGNVKIASYHKNIVNLDNLSLYVLNQGEKPKAGKINIINCWNDNVTISLGKAGRIARYNAGRVRCNCNRTHQQTRNEARRF